MSSTTYHCHQHQCNRFNSSFKKLTKGNHIEKRARLTHGPVPISKKCSDLGNMDQQMSTIHARCRPVVLSEPVTNINSTLKEIVRSITVILSLNYRMEDSKLDLRQIWTSVISGVKILNSNGSKSKADYSVNVCNKNSVQTF